MNPLNERGYSEVTDEEMAKARESQARWADKRRVTMVATDKLADAAHPTKAEIDEHGVDITESIVDPNFTLNPNEAPAIPERVTWTEVRASPSWSPTWHAHSHPIPVPGGALVLVSMPSRAARRTVTTILSWNVNGTINVVKVGDKPAIFTTVKLAKGSALDIARRLAANA